MALTGTTIFEVQPTGSDTLNGGAFDGNGQTGNMFTDGAATLATSSAPVFTSASYNFVAGDVGAWLFIPLGTNWTKGWYKIASVAANAATLSAAIGAAVGSSGAATSPVIPSTVLGCATTASPTGATWSIDYSQQAAAQFAYTDLASAGAGLTVSSVLKPFAKQHVGNSIVITGGTNFTTGRYVIASVAAGVATVLGAANITTGVGASGTGGQGGALASPGMAGAHMVSTNQLFIQTGTYTVTSASTNIAAGCFTSAGNTFVIEGYATVRGDLNPLTANGTRPTIIAGSISTFVLFTTGGSTAVRNLILDGNSQTSSRGLAMNNSSFSNILGKNFTNSAFTGGSACFRCVATGCATAAAFTTTNLHVACVAYNNTITGFSGGAQLSFCLAYGNSGAASDGFGALGNNGAFLHCSSYGNGRDGFRSSGNTMVINCIAEGNTAGVGFNLSGTAAVLAKYATYNNGGPTTLTSAVHLVDLGLITLTASPFTNAAGGDFSLNNAAGGGALCRAAGYPGTMPLGLTVGYLDIGAIQHSGGAFPVIGKGSGVVRAV